MIELNVRYTVTEPEGTISDAGIRDILHLNGAQKLAAGEWKALNPDKAMHWLPILPYDWQWVWVVTGKAEYTGTFPKRVAKYYHKEHGLKCPTSYLTEVGNLARRHAAEAVTYNFEFVARFDWSAGDYGDGGSCFWGGRAGARVMLAENGAMAIRFYDEGDRGFGRAFVVKIGESLYVLFNGYGFAGDSTVIIARVMARFLGVTYAHISLSNRGRSTGTLYINSAAGYAIGTSEAVAAISRHDFDWEEIYQEVCYQCGESLSDDEMYTGADSHVYCESCFYDIFDYCSYCDRVCWQDDITYVDYERYCERCLTSRCQRCDNCDEWVDRSEGFDHKEKFYCGRCAYRLGIG